MKIVRTGCTHVDVFLCVLSSFHSSMSLFFLFKACFSTSLVTSRSVRPVHTTFHSTASMFRITACKLSSCAPFLALNRLALLSTARGRAGRVVVRVFVCLIVCCAHLLNWVKRGATCVSVLHVGVDRCYTIRLLLYDFRLFNTVECYCAFPLNWVKGCCMSGLVVWYM